MTVQYRVNSRLAGLALILLGALLLAGTFFSLTFLLIKLIWPGILLLSGLYFLAEQVHWSRRYSRRAPFPWPLFLIAWGVSGVLKALGIWFFGIPFWPLLLVVIGLWMLWNRR